MIDLDLLRRWLMTGLALLFFGLWQLAEHRERYAVNLAAATVETNRQCMVGYWESEQLLGDATEKLTALTETTGQ